MGENNLSPFKVSATIQGKYKPVILRGRCLHEQESKSTFLQKWKSGDCNLDLWLDGSIYPRNPKTGNPPKFKCLKTLLEFVGDEAEGLLGYINNLDRKGGTNGIAVEVTNNEERGNEAVNLSMWVEFLNGYLLQREVEFQQLKEATTAEILNLREQVFESERRLDVMKAGYEVELRNCNAGVREELVKSKRSFQRLQRRLNHLTKTPFGYRQQVRQRRDIATLSQTGGHCKAQKRFLRSILAPHTTRNVQKDNAENNSTKRLHGCQESQQQTGILMAKVLSKTEINAIMQTPRLKQTGVNMANYYLKRIGESVGPHQLLETLDRNGITTGGYSALYKQFKKATSQAGRSLRISCLPNPHQVSLLRRELNSKLMDFVGEYHAINNKLEMPPTKKSKKKILAILEMNDQNSLFVDVECVQRTMVTLYEFSLEELNGDPLIFCLKIDESEIVHGQKLERVGISIVNRALNPNVTLDSPQYFSVQSERELWPVGCFQVLKECHNVLKWVFDQTCLPKLIEKQEQGQLLVVPGVGEFAIQWHLSADMKTIKCLYNLKHGANSKYCCIYCMQECVKPAHTTESTAIQTIDIRALNWEGGLFAGRIHA